MKILASINNPIETMPFIAYDLKLFLQDLS